MASGDRAPLTRIKAAIFAVALVPFLRLFVLGYRGELGANPVEFVTHSTGWWALTFLCITLAVTPVRRMTGWQVLLRLRRMLGLFAFFYATAHFVTYVWFDQWFSLDSIVADVWKRPFITVGFAAFVLLVPLAVTSTSRMMRRLGRRWAQLHRLVYLILVLGVLHFWWLKQDKNDLVEPWIFAVIAAVLLGFRLVLPWWQRRAAAGDAKFPWPQGGGAGRSPTLGATRETPGRPKLPTRGAGRAGPGPGGA